MHTSSNLKREFLKKWVKGLQICCSSKKEMDLQERKKKIKLCADIALASAKNATTSWSNALISDAKKDGENAILVDNLIGPELIKPQRKTGHRTTTTMANYNCHRRVRSKKILKKSCNVGQRLKKKKMGIMGPASRFDLATYIAKRLVKKRTQVLKRLVPGGEAMDEFSLIKEALDYILSLRVQVDVMRSFANATELLNQNVSSIVD